MDSLYREAVRRIDRVAIDQARISGLVLMENAGRNAADVIEEMLTGHARARACPSSTLPVDALLQGRRVAVVAGAGNNGGDGFVIARHLAMRGATVTTFLIVPAEKVSGDAKSNLDILVYLGHDVRHVDDAQLTSLADALQEFEWVVDAIGGTGIVGALRGSMAQAVTQVNAAGRPVLAVDIPSGLDCDTGQAVGPVIKAAVTVTFVARKNGFEAPGAQAYTGKVIVADIGIPPEKFVVPQ